MTRYWTAHSDRDWQDDCGMYEPPPAEAELEPHPVVVVAATALLEKLANMTTEEFARGGERAERRALAIALGLNPENYSL